MAESSKAKTTSGGASKAADAAGRGTAPAGTAGDAPAVDLQQMMSDAYRHYLQTAQQGQADIQQRYAAALQRYASGVRALEEDGQKSLADALVRYQHECQEAMQRSTGAQRAIVGLAQTGDAVGAAGYQTHADAFHQAQRDQEGAAQALSSELSAVWSRELPQRAQDVYAEFSQEVLAIANEVQRRSEEANREYLRSVKEFWARVDVEPVPGAGAVTGSV